MIEGIILMDKPAGLSTAHCTRKIGETLSVKTGHTGTLDPIATGLVIVMVERATKLAPWLIGMDKEYEATIRLGQTTSTGDSEGEIIDEKKVETKYEDVEQAVDSMIGEIMQVPPAHSAIKHKGKPLYKYARKGVEVEVEPRRIKVSSMNVIDFMLPYVKLKTHVSSGTYIRSLAMDIGKKLGCGAHIAELRRTRIGCFDIEDARPFEEIIAEGNSNADRIMLSSNEALSCFPAVEVKPSKATKIAGGGKIELDLSSLADCSLFRLVSSGNLIALLKKTAPEDFAFVRVFRRPEEVEN